MHPRHDTEGGSGDAPGAFIGVLLGGSTALQGRRRAGSRGQRVLAGESVAVLVMNALITAARLLPGDLAGTLHA